MKAAAAFVALFIVLLLLIPMVALYMEVPAVNSVQTDTPSQTSGGAEVFSAPEQPPDDSPAVPALTPNGIPEAEEAEEADEAHTSAQKPVEAVTEFRILDQTAGVVRTVPVRDFVRGAVAAEMPASFHPEALKAQAVAAHTLALHNHLAQQENPDPDLLGADFAADPSNLKVYVTEEIMRSFYGEQTDYYWGKICEAADSVVSYILEYEEEPIVAAYHAISAGQTEDAGNVWVGSAPYLIPVESEGDLLAPGYETTVAFTHDQMRNLLFAAFPDIELPDAPGDWFGEPERSASGYVTAIRVGDIEVHGKEVRTALDLRSHNFTISPGADGFSVTVYGYGHGVGLSQQGADFLARQGHTFDSILSTYYPGAQLRQLDFA